MINYIKLVLFIVLSFDSILAGTIDPETSDNEYINYGKNFESVVMLSGEYENPVPISVLSV